MGNINEQELHACLIDFASNERKIVGLYKGFSADEGRNQTMYYFVMPDGFDFPLCDRLFGLHGELLNQTDVRRVGYMLWPTTMDEAEDHGFLEELLWKRD